MKRTNPLILLIQSWPNGIISYYVAVLSLIIMALYYWFLPPLMILWGLVWIVDIQNKIRSWIKIPRYHKFLYILSVGFFFWQIVGLLYSDNKHEGWRNIALRLSLILFPLVLISPGEMIQKKANHLMRLFAICTFILLIICIAHAFYRSINFQNGILYFNPHPQVNSWLNYFYGIQLSIFHHPSYMSLYILFSVFIAMEAFLDKLIKRSRRIFWLVISIILLLSIYLLSSRGEIFATILAVPMYFLFRYKAIGINRIAGLIIILCIFILIPVCISNPRFYYYFGKGSNVELSNRIPKESRIAIWKSAFNIIGRNFIFGVGTGDIQNELNKEYYRSGDKDLASVKNLNTHNQFIEILLENGSIGLILFITFIGMMLYISISEGNILYIMFILIVFVSFLFETMLNRLAGVSFFALFSFLLLHLKSVPGTLSEQKSDA
jgi:O-antigen ligase